MRSDVLHLWGSYAVNISRTTETTSHGNEKRLLELRCLF